MNYLYYPGCSLGGTAVEYNLSTISLMEKLNAELVEIEDWTCCGATAAQSVNQLLSFVLPARNLALAEKMNQNLDILVPCSACYLNLKKAQVALGSDKKIKAQINDILISEDLSVAGSLNVRHLLDVLSRDVDVTDISAVAGNKMDGLTIAPYYGCQCLRPFAVFDDPESPKSMDPFIRATGAQPLDWDMGGQCCGASNASTKPAVGQALVGRILEAAEGVDAIVTVCPMCQMNLENFQKTRGRNANSSVEIPIFYLPQFLGLAMGISPETLGLGLNLSKNTQLLSMMAI